MLLESHWFIRNCYSVILKRVNFQSKCSLQSWIHLFPINEIISLCTILINENKRLQSNLSSNAIQGKTQMWSLKAGDLYSSLNQSLPQIKCGLYIQMVFVCMWSIAHVCILRVNITIQKMKNTIYKMVRFKQDTAYN